MSGKLFDILDIPAPALTPAQLSAGRWLDIARNIRGAIQDGVTVIAQDCNALGRDAILAEMPPEAAKEFETCLPLLAALWQAAASVPFPELPEKPQEGNGA